MYQGLRSSTVATPETIWEFAAFMEKYQNSIIWAGGTYIMSREHKYPSEDVLNIVSLSEISELKRISRSDEYIEFGSMVTLASFCAMAKPYLSDEINSALSRAGTDIIRSQATIGGALCTNKIKTEFATILCALDAMVEVRSFHGKSKNGVRRIPVSQLYGINGSLSLPEGSLITRLHLNNCKGGHFFYRNSGSVMMESETTTVFALRLNLENTSISEVHAVFNFPQVGLYSTDFVRSSLTSVVLPLHPSRIIKIAADTLSEIKRLLPSITDLQAEQAKRIFESVLYELNTNAIAAN